jgi:predicted dehydrogenase
LLFTGSKLTQKQNATLVFGVALDPLRVGVAGAGAFGNNHLRVLHDLPDVIITAVADSNPARAGAAAAAHGAKACRDVADSDFEADAAIVAVPTIDHAAVACSLLERGIDVLVEKPIAADLGSAQKMVDAARENGRILQVGHLERFNPAILALESALTLPLFFEIHRMSAFSTRSLDVDVVLDLMIHDIDIVLSLVGAVPEEIRAAGISILSDKVDIANVRLAFAGGCVANLTASRISTEKIRKLRLFQPGEYISLDYHRQDGAVFSVDGDQQIGFRQLDVKKVEPLRLQLESFVECVRTRRQPRVSGESGIRALKVALSILNSIEQHARIVAETLGARPCRK